MLRKAMITKISSSGILHAVASRQSLGTLIAKEAIEVDTKPFASIASKFTQPF